MAVRAQVTTRPSALLNIGVFFCSARALRNRERVRRILRAEQTDANRWLATTWPAPLMIAGTLALLAIVLGVCGGPRRSPGVECHFAVLRTLFSCLDHP